MATYEAARDAFLARNRAMGYETHVNRRGAVRSFAACLDQFGPAGGVGISVEDVTRPIVAGYQDFCLAQGQAPGTVRQRLQVLHLLWDESIPDALVRYNPMTGCSSGGPRPGSRTRSRNRWPCHWPRG